MIALPLSAALAITLTAAGCSQANTASSSPSTKGTETKSTDASTPKAATSSGEPVTIDFWFPWGGDYQKDFKASVVDVFEKQHPNIKVKMTFVETTGQTQASDKLLTAIAVEIHQTSHCSIDS